MGASLINDKLRNQQATLSQYNIRIGFYAFLRNFLCYFHYLYFPLLGSDPNVLVYLYL